VWHCAASAGTPSVPATVLTGAYFDLAFFMPQVRQSMSTTKRKEPYYQFILAHQGIADYKAEPVTIRACFRRRHRSVVSAFLGLGRREQAYVIIGIASAGHKHVFFRESGLAFLVEHNPIFVCRSSLSSFPTSLAWLLQVVYRLVHTLRHITVAMIRFLTRLRVYAALSTILILYITLWYPSTRIQNSIRISWRKTPRRVIVFGDDWSDTGKYRMAPPPSGTMRDRSTASGVVWTETLCKEVSRLFVATKRGMWLTVDS